MANIPLADKYTITSKKTELFSDFGTDLQIHPGKRDLVRYTNETAIKRSIINLLLTDYHERMYQPYLGANLKKLLFEPIGEDILSQMKHHILTCISKFEPRVSVTSISLAASPDEHQINVSLVFTIVNSGTSTTFEFILNRVR